jgi:hypothetical protein
MVTIEESIHLYFEISQPADNFLRHAHHFGFNSENLMFSFVSYSLSVPPSLLLPKVPLSLVIVAISIKSPNIGRGNHENTPNAIYFKSHL